MPKVLLKEPSLIDGNGGFNPAWQLWYQQKHGCTPVTARFQHIERIKAMPEPKLSKTGQFLSVRWVHWYRIHNNVTTNIAKKCGLAKLKLLQQGNA